MRRSILALVLLLLLIAAISLFILTSKGLFGREKGEEGWKEKQRTPGKEVNVSIIEYQGIAIRVEEFFVQNPSTGDIQRILVFSRKDVPKGPAVILVPGRGGSSEVFMRENGALYAAASGFVAIAFDPLGRGKSKGTPNDYGSEDQAIFPLLYSIAKERGDGRVGAISLSYGITLVAGALANYDVPLAFWIDWEGPCNRIFTSCYCDEIPREAFKRATDEELDQARKRILERLKKNYKGPAKSCYDNDYWKEREAIKLIERARPEEIKYYVRLQSDDDHVQPNYDHSIMMVNAMVDLGFKTRLNYGPWNLVYDRQSIIPFLYPREPETVAIIRAVDIALSLLGLDSRKKPYPIYVTVVMHNEEPPTNPDFISDRNVYLQSRKLLEKFAKLLTKYGAAFDWQSEWNFLKAVQMYDVGEVTVSTDGKNIVQYLHDLGVSVDPHAHETTYNYADIAHLMRQLGVEPSEVVGGFLYYPPENQQGWEKFKEPIKGVMFPNAVWKGRILWGASTYLHQGPDLLATGIWRPKDKYHFLTHDPNQPLIYIGSYRRDARFIGGLPELVRLIEEGELESGMYTVTIFVAQMTLSEDCIEWFEKCILKPLQLYEEQGVIEWATLPEMVEIWLDKYGGQPSYYLPEDQKKIIESLFPP